MNSIKCIVPSNFDLGSKAKYSFGLPFKLYLDFLLPILKMDLSPFTVWTIYYFHWLRTEAKTA